MAKYSFDTGDNSFFKILRSKVDHYFAEQELQPSGNSKLYFKGILMIASAVGLYVSLVFYTPITPIAILL
jgi:linoleoyl-CoA desaturase